MKRTPLTLAFAAGALTGLATLGALASTPGCTSQDAAALADAPVWFQLDDNAPDADELTGYLLRVGRVGKGETFRIALAPEAFAAGPFTLDGDDVVLFGENEPDAAPGARSRIELLHPRTAKRRVLLESDHVLRRAVLAHDTLYVHVLAQETREELGIYALDVRAALATDRAASLDDAALLLPGMAREEVGRELFGPTFATALWAVDGGLVVQSCGELLCRARVLDHGSGNVTLRDEIGQGEIIGVTPTTLIAYESGNGWPCKVLAIDVATGQASELAHAYGAAVVPDELGRATLVYESGDEPGALYARAVDVEEGTAPRLLALFGDDELHPVPHAGSSLAALALPAGHVVVGGDGRIARVNEGPSALIVRLSDGALFNAVDNGEGE